MRKNQLKTKPLKKPFRNNSPSSSSPSTTTTTTTTTAISSKAGDQTETTTKRIGFSGFKINNSQTSSIQKSRSTKQNATTTTTNSLSRSAFGHFDNDHINTSDKPKVELIDTIEGNIATGKDSDNGNKRPLVIPVPKNQTLVKSSRKKEAGSDNDSTKDKRGDSESVANNKDKDVRKSHNSYGLQIMSNSSKNKKPKTTDKNQSSQVLSTKPSTSTSKPIPKKSFTQDNDNNEDGEETLRNKAIQSLLSNSDEDESSNPNRTAVISTESNSTRLEERERKAYHASIGELPDETTLEGYSEVPIEDFGAALLRGMGWNEDQDEATNGAGQTHNVDPFAPRQSFLGLGAKPMPPHLLEKKSRRSSPATQPSHHRQQHR
ncbi:hypothetical protein H4219_006169 [Mycoemilia scoparia]|uniref:Spp2/MOS2 G-patch domain-containing protein n=1 Tax=Mycoemilia scoparia TaxID=417184 RepID=A0A9W8DI97_9FUNG|nr:hypothetical protein H4219_006169 [Mycoemilia scoparia]